MSTAPLNRARALPTWPAFDPGAWLDFNPTCVDLPDGRPLGVIRRDRFPPVPGHGTLWTVPLDAALQPAGPPSPLLGRGEDPRAVRIGDRLFVFYAVIERDANDRVNGSSVRLGEFRIDGDALVPLRHLELPKNPLAKGDGPRTAWEKNWVPFVVSPTEIGLVYSHEPWQVIVFAADPTDERRHFKAVHTGPALQWRHGEVRGGTTPVPWGEGQWISFFHSSVVIGSRKLYMVGACVFDAAAPFTPRLMTHEPLLVAPYHSGAHRFGWRFAGSVVFPLGARAHADGWRLLCGVDDGAVGTFDITRDELRARLAPIGAPAALRNVHGDMLATRGEPLVLQDFEPGSVHAARLLDLLCGGEGGRFVDAAPADGAATLRLAPRFAHTLALAADPKPLQRLAAINGVDTLELRAPIPVDALDLPTLALLRVDDAARAEPVLQGAFRTLQRCRPVLLLQLPEGDAGTRVEALLAEAGYTCEALFPFTPARRLALPAERRAEFAWMV